jgi:hypothetical protein
LVEETGVPTENPSTSHWQILSQNEWDWNSQLCIFPGSDIHTRGSKPTRLSIVIYVRRSFGQYIVYQSPIPRIVIIGMFRG